MEDERKEDKKIQIEDFVKVEIRLGTVESAEVVEGADKLYRLTVDLGETEKRQILSAIRPFVLVEDLVGKQFPFIANLAPRNIRGLESNGMILAAGDDEQGLALFAPSKKMKNGTLLR